LALLQRLHKVWKPSGKPFLISQDQKGAPLEFGLPNNSMRWARPLPSMWSMVGFSAAPQQAQDQP
jgi:hypothetical protein